ncbi:hypothetical protein [Phaeocystidibacter marisrubri]|uniref:Uncharacterized protein n=1 Tax=Phaeocystidibacter marisrubri TaxID=1577780 RepID=A0A6L3ZF18_9FLAO|nr:hypothetical protein [Phaeocystidibacter marisrubri]KAB2816007.1 hypothetical protein F8C82_09945 [Phaeocystidibacter marisrubri]GGH66850.1 hypothetical protein GCM10011318_05230 [Phaeocystidibacter marisrubri]
MKNVFSILALFLCVNLFGTVPEYLDVTRRNAGPNGYDKVDQKWTDREGSKGELKCINEGSAKCAWQESGVGEYPIDLDLYTELILTEYENNENDGSGTINVNGEIFSFTVIESLGEGDGTVRYYFHNL